LNKDEIPALVRLEISEYTQRQKISELPARLPKAFSVSIPLIGKAIGKGDREVVAGMFSAYLEKTSPAELARCLLLIGGEYLGNSLGHSVSCTAFILLEMMERPDKDYRPALGCLADYFCKGGFSTMPGVNGTIAAPPPEKLDNELLKATSGDGIVNLHHTITRYAIESARHLLTEAEYAHLVDRWIDFINPKDAEAPVIPPASVIKADYKQFYDRFSQRDEQAVLALLAGMVKTREGRKTLARHLIKGVCDEYRGSYDPHFLTGLGSAIWVVNNYHIKPAVAVNALRQYVNYFLSRS
jgi:hypothetical protein